MTTREFHKLFKNVLAEVNELLSGPNELGDRLRWLALFDYLDVLKDDLLKGNGWTWPAGVREVYVRVRTGLKELFALLFAEVGEPAAVYAQSRLAVYRDRLRDALPLLAPTGPTPTP